MKSWPIPIATAGSFLLVPVVLLTLGAQKPKESRPESRDESHENADSKRPEEVAAAKRLSLERRWGDCGEMPSEGNQTRVKDLTADRSLTAREKDCILRIGDILLDRDLDWVHRERAAAWLGEMGHAYCMPALLAVLRDQSENKEVRAKCAFCLANIADKRVVDPLIDAFTDSDLNVAGDAWFQLNKTLGFRGVYATDIPHPGLDANEWRGDLAWRKQEQAKYRAWWKQNRNRVKLNRAATFMSG